MDTRARAAQALLALLALLARPAAARPEGPACREGTDCVLDDVSSSGMEFFFKVKGTTLNVEYDESQKLISVQCDQGSGDERVAADDPVLPVLPALAELNIAEFAGCRLPKGSYAAALRALNVTVAVELRLLRQPAAPSLTRQHLAGVDVRKFKLDIDEGLMRPEPDFLAELPRLEWLTLARVLVSRALLTLPTSLTYLVLSEVDLPAAEQELRASPEPAERAAATNWLARLSSLRSLSLVEQEAAAAAEAGGPRLTPPPLRQLPRLVHANILAPLEQLPERWLYGSQLQRLYLTTCDLSSLANLPFEGSNLTILNISQNNLTDLPKHVFESLGGLEELDVSRNRLSRAALERALPPLRALRVLRASDNPLGSLCGSSSIAWGKETSKLPHTLRRLELRVTGATRICSDWLTDPALEIIDLRYNDIEYLEYNDIVMTRNASASSVQLMLEHNPLRDLPVSEMELAACSAAAAAPPPKDPEENRHVRVDLLLSELSCDCRNARLRALLGACPLLALGAAACARAPGAFLDHAPDQLLCRFNDSCVPGCTCGWGRLSDNATVVECEGSLGAAPRWPEATAGRPLALSAPRAGLTRVPPLLLRELRAPHNAIAALTAADIPATLRVLDLRNNSLARVSAAAAARLRGVRTRLAGNPFACACADRLALAKLKDANVTDWNELRCGSPDALRGRYLSGLQPDELCSSVLPWLALGAAVVVVLLAAGALLWIRGKPLLKQFLFKHQLCLDWVLGADDTVDDPAKTHDAFVSYAHQDHAKAAAIVHGLERRGYTTVEHCRDWMPGAAVAEHIARSVLCARRTLLLVSDDYGASKWALEEFRAAHAHALERRSARVLLLRCGLRAPERLPPDLRLHLRFNTYLDCDDAAFWDKLCRVMPPLRAAPSDVLAKNEKLSLAARFVSGPLTLPPTPHVHTPPGGKQPQISETQPLADKRPRLWTPPAPRAAPVADDPPRLLTPPPPRAAQAAAADRLRRLLTPPAPRARQPPAPAAAPERSCATPMDLAPRAAPGAC